MQTASPEVLLLRSVISTTAHDLGGLASALLLRADVLQNSSSETSVDALRSIAGELRVLGQELRSLHGKRGANELSPTRTASLSLWFARVNRFGPALLPRGSAIRGQLQDAPISADSAHHLTYLTLAVFADARERWPDARLAIQIADIVQDDHATISLQVENNNQPADFSEDTQRTWWQWATQYAAEQSLPFAVTSERIELRVPVVVAT